MNTLDEQFRNDLQDAITSATPTLAPLDPASLIDAGHRVVVRRRIGASAGGLAAVATLALLATAALGGNDQATRTVVPGATTSEVKTASVLLHLDPGPASTDSTPTDFGVKVSDTGNVRYSFPDREGGYGSAVDGSGTDATLGWDGTSDFMLGVVPQDAVGVGFPGLSGADGYTTTKIVSIPGTKYGAVAFRFTKVPDKDFHPQPIWFTADHRPHVNATAGAPKILALGDGSNTVAYAIEGLDTSGTVSGGQQTSSYWKPMSGYLSKIKVSDVPAQGMATVIVSFPTDQGLTMTPNADAGATGSGTKPVQAVRVEKMTDTEWWGVFEMPTAAIGKVSSASWTAADGSTKHGLIP